MAKNLIPLTVEAPGFFGLNTQQSGSVLPPGWATKLENFVFDDSGRIGSRKGTRKQHATVISGTPTIGASHEFKDAAGNVVNIIAADNKIFKEVGGTVTDVSGTITTPTGDDWQFVNFNGWCVGMQNGHAPIIATDATAVAFANGAGTQYNGDMVCSAYGRLWTVYANTLYYSDLLTNNFTGGSSGSFDLAKFWPNGMDTATAVVDFGGFLVVFGKESIIVYENADDVVNMAITEGVEGIGCPYRDSIQKVGKEVVFMSAVGITSLGRALSQGNLPLTDMSKNVRDQLLADSASEVAVKVKSVYNKADGFYLVSFPIGGVSYCFNVKRPNEDNSWRATTWTETFTAMNYTEAGEMHVAHQAGFLSEYTGWRDGDLSSGTGGAAYTLNFEGVWNDFGEEVSPLFKVLKTVSLLGSGTASTAVTFKWAVDYSTSFTTLDLAFNNNPPSQFGVAKFGIDVFAAQGDFERIKASMSKTGQVIKIGVTTEVSGTSFALQRIDILAKAGRIGL